MFNKSTTIENVIIFTLTALVIILVIETHNLQLELDALNHKIESSDEAQLRLLNDNE